MYFLLIYKYENFPFSPDKTLQMKTPQNEEWGAKGEGGD